MLVKSGMYDEFARTLRNETDVLIGFPKSFPGGKMDPVSALTFWLQPRPNLKLTKET